LCNGLGPAMFGLIFYVFHVDLNEGENQEGTHSTPVHDADTYSQVKFFPFFVLFFFFVELQFALDCVDSFNLAKKIIKICMAKWKFLPAKVRYNTGCLS
jgi:hypothetical protein